VRFSTHRGQIVGFVVQLEGKFGGSWQPVVRYDTAHGFAHQDVLHPYKVPQKIELDVQDYNQAMTYAIQDLTQNWQRYVRRYEIWRKSN
jgi:hypothetical protein